MYFKIDYDKVSDVGYYLKNKSEELDTLYEDVLQICDKIEENYVSEDSTIYLAKFRRYINVFGLENQNLRTAGMTLNKTSSLYSNQEDKWEKRIAQSELNKGGKDNVI